MLRLSALIVAAGSAGKWSRPIINTVMLPAHASTTNCDPNKPAPPFIFEIEDGRTGKNLNDIATVTLFQNGTAISTQKSTENGQVVIRGFVPSPGLYDMRASAPGYKTSGVDGVHTARYYPACNTYYTLTLQLPLNPPSFYR